MKRKSLLRFLKNVKIIHGVPKVSGDLASWKRMGSRDQSQHLQYADYCEVHATSLAELAVHATPISKAD
jgi:hypothetical protein